MYASIFTTDVDRHDLLYDIASNFSPIIEETEKQSVVFDIDGTSSLIGTTLDVAKAIYLQSIDSGLNVNVAIAANPDAAICAAQFLKKITIIQPGKETKRLGDVPVEALYGYLNIRSLHKG